MTTQDTRVTVGDTVRSGDTLYFHADGKAYRTRPAYDSAAWTGRTSELDVQVKSDRVLIRHRCRDQSPGTRCRLYGFYYGLDYDDADVALRIFCGYRSWSVFRRPVFRC